MKNAANINSMETLKTSVDAETEIARKHARLSNAVEAARRAHGIFSTDYLDVLAYAEETVASWN